MQAEVECSTTSVTKKYRFKMNICAFFLLLLYDVDTAMNLTFNLMNVTSWGNTDQNEHYTICILHAINNFDGWDSLFFFFCSHFFLLSLFFLFLFKKLDRVEQVLKQTGSNEQIYMPTRQDITCFEEKMKKKINDDKVLMYSRLQSIAVQIVKMYQNMSILLLLL